MHIADWLMDQQQVDIPRVQPVQRSLYGAQGVRILMTALQLCGNEKFFPWNSRLLAGKANLTFVPIALCRVNGTIANAERTRNTAFRDAR